MSFIMVSIMVKSRKYFDETADSPRTAISEFEVDMKDGDVVITSSLINLSLDFVTALLHVSNFVDKGVTYSIKEKFNSSEEYAKILLSYLPLMRNFRTAAFNSSKQNDLTVEKGCC